MGVRRLLVFALGAVVGCAAISGVGDLVVDGVDASVERAIDAAPEATAPPPDAADDVEIPEPPVDGGGIDANVDAGPTRVRTVTFEGASLTGPQGADTITGLAALQNAGALDGAHSMKISGSAIFASVTSGVAGLQEVYVSMLVRVQDVDPNGAAYAPILRVVVTDTTHADLVVSDPPGGSFGLSINGGAPIAIVPYDSKFIYRIGIHAKNGLVEGFVDDTPATPFAAAFATSTIGVPGFNGVKKIDFGAIAPAFKVSGVFDDLLVDTASMPP